MRNLTKHIASMLTIRFRPGVVRAGGKLHLAFYRIFHGAGPLGADTLILTTRGRTTGEPRSTPLYYVDHDGRRYIAASFAGSDTPPHWYQNLIAHPQVQVNIRGRSMTCRAQVLPPDETRRIWPRLVTVYPPFHRYQQRTSRRIPVIELIPTDMTHPPAPADSESTGAPDDTHP